MATSPTQIRPPAIRPKPGVTLRVALQATTGRTIPWKFPDPNTGAMEQVVFEAMDGASLYLFSEDASALEHALLELGIRAGEDFFLTQVKFARGGGSCLRVSRISDPQPSRGSRAEPPQRSVAGDQEARLAQSVALARRDPQAAREAFREAAAPARQPNSQPAVEPHNAAILGAYKTAIDVLLGAQAYANGLGLMLDVHCEDVRCLAATLIIQGEGRRV